LEWSAVKTERDACQYLFEKIEFSMNKGFFEGLMKESGNKEFGTHVKDILNFKNEKNYREALIGLFSELKKYEAVPTLIIVENFERLYDEADEDYIEESRSMMRSKLFTYFPYFYGRDVDFFFKKAAYLMACTPNVYSEKLLNKDYKIIEVSNLEKEEIDEIMKINEISASEKLKSELKIQKPKDILDLKDILMGLKNEDDILKKFEKDKEDRYYSLINESIETISQDDSEFISFHNQIFQFLIDLNYEKKLNLKNSVFEEFLNKNKLACRSGDGHTFFDKGVVNEILFQFFKRDLPKTKFISVLSHRNQRLENVFSF
jgi:hypothetical protein